MAGEAIYPVHSKWGMYTKMQYRMMENKFGGGHYLECMYPAMSIVGAKSPCKK